VSAAFETMSSLVLEDGRRWGEAAEPLQREDARAVLDPASTPPYHFLTRARGYAKTSDVAGFAASVMLAQLPPGARLYGLAADKEQGRLLLDSIDGYARRTRELAGALTVDAFKVTARRGGQVLEILAADAPSSYGLRPAFLVIDEVAQWAETPGPRKLFDATTSALTKIEGARCVVITSAGDPSHWSYRVLEHARADPLWHTHEIGGPAPWADRGRLAEQKRRLLPSTYARLFDNLWMAGEDKLTTRDDVLACVGHTGDLAYQAGQRYVVTLDVGLTNDRTVAVVAHSESRGEMLTVVVDRIAVWQGSRDRPVRLDVVEAWLEEACRSYEASLVFDPFQAAHLTQRLKQRGLWVVPFVFSQASVGRLAVTTYRLLRDHLFDLPDDEALVDEFSGVRLVETSPGAFRIDHSSSGHDDRVIAVALAASHLLSVPSWDIAGLVAAHKGAPSIMDGVMDQHF
jgi:phage terminase large subunit-like protein